MQCTAFGLLVLALCMPINMPVYLGLNAPKRIGDNSVVFVVLFLSKSCLSRFGHAIVRAGRGFGRGPAAGARGLAAEPARARGRPWR